MTILLTRILEHCTMGWKLYISLKIQYDILENLLDPKISCVMLNIICYLAHCGLGDVHQGNY